MKNLRHAFWPHICSSTMQQKWVRNFLQQETGAFESNTAKEPQKHEKYVYYIFTENICSASNPVQVVVFCKHVLIL